MNAKIVAFSLMLAVAVPFLRADRRVGRNTTSLPDVAANEYFVAFTDGLSPANERGLEAAGARITRRFPRIRVAAVRASAAQAAALERLPRVEYVEPVPTRYKMGLNDTQLTPALTNGLYGLITTKSTNAHAASKTGMGVKVGVADTGIDYTHPDIVGAYINGIDTVDNDTDPSWNNDPDETHATHVAGTVLGRNNFKGVLGVAYDAQLYHARVLGPNGGTSATVMDGVRWLVETAGCRIVNMSLGGGRPSRAESAFYQDMRAQGALIIAATGNDSDATRINYPANYPVNIAVGAVDVNNVRASFSNGGSNIDVVAPGVAVLSSVPIGTGAEASVTSGLNEYVAVSMEFAPKTNGITKILVNCGLGQPGECPASVSGNIALIQRGTNSFGEKVANAMAQGAVGAIVYNNEPGLLIGTLGSRRAPGRVPWIPALGVSDVTGAQLLSAVGSQVTMKAIVSNWDMYDGTSMATPHVSGVAALIWAINPSLTPAQVEAALFSTTTDLGAAGFDTLYGRGIVNAQAAIAAVP